uniref:Uncharacterized protein n=1 Tax=Chlamydomonas euryale TaxID=1486919 RepID=A0A7R9VHG8_9CHLO
MANGTAVAEQATGEWHRGCRAGHWRVALRLQSRPIASGTAADTASYMRQGRQGQGGPRSACLGYPSLCGPFPASSPPHMYTTGHTHTSVRFFGSCTIFLHVLACTRCLHPRGAACSVMWLCAAGALTGAAVVVC